MKISALIITAFLTIAGFASFSFAANGNATNYTINQLFVGDNGNCWVLFKNANGSNDGTVYWINGANSGSKNLFALLLQAWQRGAKVDFNFKDWFDGSGSTLTQIGSAGIHY